MFAGVQLKGIIIVSSVPFVQSNDAESDWPAVIVGFRVVSGMIASGEK